VQFWSAQANGCTLPGCTSTTVTLPGGTAEVTTTIDYTYDPLYRLTNADYSTGDSYQYAYDSVGNRLTQESFVHGLSSSVTYNYDLANRLEDVNGVAYTYDDNGNLRSDGVNTYTYDSANRLTSVNGADSYTYNGLGDRLSQTVNGQVTNYTLDLNAGLTQVLSDGTTSYTYGLGHVSQQNGNTAEYFLGDALGSVRQLVNNTGNVTLGKSYDPYGVITNTSGVGQSAYGYTGESHDADNGLVYLRSRYYNVADGRFQSRDTWGGNQNMPLSFNKWNYTDGNPVNRTDPVGKCWYQSVSDLKVYFNPLEQPSDGPCVWFTGVAAQVGVNLSPNASPQDVLTGKIPYGPPAPVQPAYTIPDDFWQVIQFTFDLQWETSQTTTFGGSLHPTIWTPIGPIVVGRDASCTEFFESCETNSFVAYGISDYLCGGSATKISWSEKDGLAVSMGLYHQVGQTETYSTIGQTSTSVPVVPLVVPAIASAGQSVQSVTEHRGRDDIYVLTNKPSITAFGGYAKLALMVNPEKAIYETYEILASSSSRQVLKTMFSSASYNLQEKVITP
jgi:RHS repeat-associated protein